VISSSYQLNLSKRKHKNWIRIFWFVPNAMPIVSKFVLGYGNGLQKSLMKLATKTGALKSRGSACVDRLMPGGRSGVADRLNSCNYQRGGLCSHLEMPWKYSSCLINQIVENVTNRHVWRLPLQFFRGKSGSMNVPNWMER
jgi:hypothetical protein